MLLLRLHRWCVRITWSARTWSQWSIRLSLPTWELVSLDHSFGGAICQARLEAVRRRRACPEFTWSVNPAPWKPRPADTLAGGELWALLFEPGVSTFSIRLPLTLAILDGFTVGTGGEIFVLPVEAVIECVELPLPWVRLDRLLRLPSAATERESVVVVRDGEELAGLAVDALYGESQTVIKPLPRALPPVGGVSGTAILDNGRVALVLDVDSLLRRESWTEA